MSEGLTCYERDEAFCEDGMCLRTGCRLRNKRLEEVWRWSLPKQIPLAARAVASITLLVLALLAFKWCTG